MSRSHLTIVHDPRSIAVIGASENPNKIGGRPLRYLRKYGYAGKVYAVNPARTEVQGYRSYASVDELPEVPEAAIIIVAGDAVEDAVERCARLGVKVGVIMASGFGEVSDEGKQVEARMRLVAHEHGMRLFGPNSQGMANFSNGAILSFSTMFAEIEGTDGPIAVISQSGAMASVLYGMFRRRGLGVRYAHATGNDADVSALELATAVASDPDIKLLTVYFEALRDTVALAELAAVARGRGLPVLVLKSGRTAPGAIAARSHTGALGNDDPVVEAFLAKHGIWRARDSVELVHATELYLRGWKPNGRRTVVISNSGATCVLSADAVVDNGIELAPLSERVRGELRAVLPAFATTANPIDLTAALLTNSALFSEVLPILSTEPSADSFVLGLPVLGEGYDVERFAVDSGVFARATGKPVVVSSPQDDVAARFAAEGIPTFPSEVEAVKALAQFLNHHALVTTAIERAPLPPLTSLRDRLDGPMRTADASEALALLASRGLSVGSRDERSDDVARELTMVAKIDPAAGAVVQVLDGGRDGDVMNDVATLVAPFDESEAFDALGSLRIAPIIARSGSRESLACAAVALAQLLADPAIRVMSIDAKSLSLYSSGGGYAIHDASVTFAV
ncbi:MAG: acetate--CoA ligase family protein [Acidimicrobiia bacterium]